MSRPKLTRIYRVVVADPSALNYIPNPVEGLAPIKPDGVTCDVNATNVNNAAHKAFAALIKSGGLTRRPKAYSGGWHNTSIFPIF